MIRKPLMRRQEWPRRGLGPAHLPCLPHLPQPLAGGLAGSLALHLCLAALVFLGPLLWEGHRLRMPVRDVLLVELPEAAPPPAPAARAARRAKAAPAPAAPAPVRPASGPREETVSLASPGKYRGYLSEIKRRIEQGWEPGAGEGELMLIFSVENDGRLSRLRLLRSSGDRGLDESALSAVRRAAPFAPMPASMNLARLNVKAGFCYRLASR